jgi:hypothetical protein
MRYANYKSYNLVAKGIYNLSSEALTKTMRFRHFFPGISCCTVNCLDT